MAPHSPPFVLTLFCIMAHWFLTDCAAQNLHILDEELLVGITPDNSDGNSGLLLSDFWDCDSWAQPLAAYDEAQFPPTLPEVPIRNDRFDAPQWLAQPEESTYRLAGTTFELLGATAEHEMEENIEAWMDNAMFEMQEDKHLDQCASSLAGADVVMQENDGHESKLSNRKNEKCPSSPRAKSTAGRRRQVSGSKREILLREFKRNPYPDYEAIDRLAQETGLNKKQIKVWFNNRRSRHLQRNDVTLTHDVHDLTLWRNTQTPLHLTASNLDEMQQNFDPATSPSPLATYIDTPLSEDPAQLAAIQKQAASLPRIDSQSSTTSHRYQPYSRVNSAQSIGSSGGSCDSLQSHSRSSNRGARKGRRLYTETQQAENEAFVPNLSKSAAYFCTFCGKELRDRYQWKRHEESLHVPRSLWVCDLAPCPEQKDVDERTFMRRDQYVQHVGIVHGRKSEDIVKNARIDAPDIPPGHPALKCGFCGKVCAGWSNRVNHVLRHFQEGMKLTSWWLGRLMFEDFMPRLWELEKPAILGDTDTSREISVWSCREIQNISAAFRPDVYEPDTLRFCSYCGQEFQGPDWTESLRHVVSEHCWRECGQDIFCSQREYYEHLRTAHAASALQTVTSELCRHARVVLDDYELVREAGLWDVRPTFKNDPAG